jgi:crossover junction endodeoxyribonuclease RusA
MNTPIAKFELPLPPGINQSYKIGTCHRTGRKRIVSKAEHKQFKRDAALLLANQKQLMDTEERKEYNCMIEDIRKNRLFLFLEVFFFLEDILSRDEDGGLKVVQDSVCKCLGIDDKYVMDAHIGKRRANGNPMCEVSVYLFEEDAA